MRASWRWNWFAWVLCGLICGASATVFAGADEAELQAQLVWATDGTKTAGKELKELDAATRDKLRGVFRWKEYLEISKKDFKVTAAVLSRVRLSPKCEIEVERFGQETFEVKLFGEGRMVVKKRQSLKPAELLVLAGDDKDDTAWFVVIRLKPAAK
jgi:hypothetical protein